MLVKSIQKHRLAILLIFAIIVALFGWQLLPDRSSSENNETETTKPYEISMNARRVFIEGFHIYQDSHDYHTGVRAHGSIENSLYTYVSQDKPGLYTGTIRQNSFKKTSQTSAELLVDVEPSQVTYKIILLDPDGKGYRPASVECASQQEQINPSVKCIDGGLPIQ